VAQIEAEAQRQEAEAQKAIALDRLGQIKRINNTLFDIFEEFDLRSIKESGEPVEYVLAEKLVEAGQKLDARAIHDPLVLAKLQDSLGITLLSLSRASEAVELLTAARANREAQLSPDHPDTLESMNNLAGGYLEVGKPGQALPLFVETLKLTKAKLGADHPNTLTIVGNLAWGYAAAGKLDLENSIKSMYKLMK
jgi:hypothetical protein